MRSSIVCIVLSSLQHKRQQIKPSTEVGLRQNQDEEDDSEVSFNNDAPLVSPILYFLCMNGAVGQG